MVVLNKLKVGDAVAIVSPSKGAPGMWPHVYELGLKRIREDFGLVPVEFPSTRKIGASTQERAQDLIAAFENKNIKAVIASLGGDDQVTYIKNLPAKPFFHNPKPFFGFSDNTHFANFLWSQGIPSYYGGCVFTQFAEESSIHPFTVKYLRKALFEPHDMVEIEASSEWNDEDLDWNDPSNLNKERVYENKIDIGHQFYKPAGKTAVAKGITWGGCVESLDEILRHNVTLPTLEQFNSVILVLETSEEMPDSVYVNRFMRALGERGILQRIRAVMKGRPKTSNTLQQMSSSEKSAYKLEQTNVIKSALATYNPNIGLVTNVDFGHTKPQIPLPMGAETEIDFKQNRIRIQF